MLALAAGYAVVGPFVIYAMARSTGLPTRDELGVFCVIFYVLATGTLLYYLNQCLRFCDGEESCERNCFAGYLFWWWLVVLITFVCVVFAGDLPN